MLNEHTLRYQLNIKTEAYFKSRPSKYITFGLSIDYSILLVSGVDKKFCLLDINYNLCSHQIVTNIIHRLSRNLIDFFVAWTTQKWIIIDMRCAHIFRTTHTGGTKSVLERKVCFEFRKSFFSWRHTFF